MSCKQKIAIVGAGASGLFSSIILSQYGYNVTLYEKNNKVGKKLLATGNGRCNITNSNIKLSNFHSTSNIKCIKKIIDNFTFNNVKEFFYSIGIELTQGTKTKYFPMSQSALSVVEALEYEAIKCGVKIVLNHTIEDIKCNNDKFILNSSTTTIYDKIIIASGSKAMPKLGSSESGYNIAKQFKHTIISPFPSLVQLISNEKNLDAISGIKVIGKVSGITGDILFTKYGLSGNSILDISRNISNRLQSEKEVVLSLDILPSYSYEQLQSLLNKRIQILKDKNIELFLDGILNKKLSKFIIQKSNLSSSIKIVKFLSSKDINKIISNIKTLQFTIIDTKGFETCEVCAGGISTKEINMITMESNLQKNLFFIGEVLDIDGDCGGYNLHFAWASANACTKSIMEEYK